MEYKEWIKAVEDPFNQFRALIHQVIIKRPPGVDDAEIDWLNERKDALKAKVGGYKTSLRNKAKELRQSSSVNSAELEHEKEKDKKEKDKKLKKSR